MTGCAHFPNSSVNHPLELPEPVVTHEPIVWRTSGDSTVPAPASRAQAQTPAAAAEPASRMARLSKPIGVPSATSTALAQHTPMRQPAPRQGAVGRPVQDSPQVVRAQSSEVGEITALPGEAVHEGGMLIEDAEECCEEPCCGYEILAGIGYYYLKPYWKTNPAYVVLQNNIEGHHSKSNLDDVNFVKDFDWDGELAPRVWVGFVCCNGWGARAHYWRFDESVTQSVRVAGTIDRIFAASGGVKQGDVEADSEGDALTVSNHLELDVFDVEALKQFRIGCCSVMVSGGLRYANLRQRYQASEINADSKWDSEDAVQISNSFKGVGPTLGVEAKYPLWCGFSLYGNSRFSVLFGDGKFRSFESQSNRFGELAQVDVNTIDRDEVLPIGELELGVEWSHDMGKCLLVARAGAVAQIWWGAGNASGNGNLLGGDYSHHGNEFGLDNNDVNLGFLGMTASVGIVY
jgi:hypothetical protein